MPPKTIAEHDSGQRGGVATEGSDGPAFAILRRYWPQLRHLLPSHVKPEAWYATVYAALYRGTNRSAKQQLDLITCANINPESLMFALFDAARQGLEPGTEQYYLTPRPNKNAKGGFEVLGIRGYQGEIELIYRAGAVSSVIADAYRQNDYYRYKRGVDPLPVHDYDPWARKSSRGELRGAYCYCVMKDGAISQVVQVNQDDIDRAKRASPTAKSEYSPWNTDEEAMWLKTAVHREHKFVPTSAEYINIHTSVRATAMVDAQRQAPNDGPEPQALSPLTQAARSALPAGATEATSIPEPPFDPSVFAQPSAPEDTVDVEPSVPGDQPRNPDSPPASQAQHRAIMRLLGSGITDGHRHAVYTSVLNRPVTTGKDLTVADASNLIETLNTWHKAGELDTSIAALNPDPRDASQLWQQVLDGVPEDWTTQEIEQHFFETTGIDAGKATATDMQRYLDSIAAKAGAS